MYDIGGVLALIVNAKTKVYDPRECEVCGDEYIPTHGRQRYCPICRQYFGAGHYPRTGGPTDVSSNEASIRKRFEDKARNCTIVGEGYAERQIEESLRIAGKVKTEL